MQNIAVQLPASRQHCDSQVFVNNHTGKSITLDVKASDTIDVLKSKIQDKIKIPAEQQRLIFAAKYLENGHTLAEYAVQQQSKLQLTSVLLGGMKVSIALPNGKEITMEVHDSETVADVKAMVEHQEKVPAHQLCLAYEGEELEDGRTLASYKLDTRTSLRLVPRRLAKVLSTHVHT